MDNKPDALAQRGIAVWILEYLRVLAWPLLVLFLVLSFKQNFVSLMSERTFKIGTSGIEVGDSISALKKNASAELDDIRKQVATLQTHAQNEKVVEVSKNIDDKIKATDVNLKKEINRIELQASGSASVGSATLTVRPKDVVEKVETLERRGFEALENHDLENALKQFSEAAEQWPDYHNVSEITKLLKQMKDESKGAPGVLPDKAWRDLYRIILTQYSWGIPAEIRGKLREKVVPSSR